MDLRRQAAAAGLAGALAAAGAVAAQPSGAVMAESCATCHGLDAKPRGAIPRLAGRPAAELAQALRDFRDGRRPGTVMGRIAKGYSDAEIDATAAAVAKGGKAK